jgi:hypothetical protein
MLRAGRTHGNDHDPVRNELLQERRWDVIDAAGDDDLVKRRVLLPAVIAVGVTCADRAILAIAARDETIVGARVRFAKAGMISIDQTFGVRFER